MGLTDNDMRVISLSSINAGKSQLLLLESASMILEHGRLQNDIKMGKSSNIRESLSTLARRHPIRNLSHLLKGGGLALDDSSSKSSDRRRNVLSNDEGTMEQSLRILIGSVGSKSNKVDYVKGLLSFLAQHSNLSKSVLWTPSTTRVASLYSAADVYVINSQGLGETFGRVTVEYMAFGLPVLGTDAGGTREIVDHNVTVLLHPTGRQGIMSLQKISNFYLRTDLQGRKWGWKEE